MSHARRLPSMLASVLVIGCVAQGPSEAVPPGASSDAPAPSAPAPSAASTDTPFLATTVLGEAGATYVKMGARPRPRLDAPPSAAPPPPPPPPAAPSPAARLLPALTGGTFDRAYGAALDAAIAALPEDRRALGLVGIERDALFDEGDTAGLCEDPHILLPVDGSEASVTVPAWSWFAGPPERDLQPLPEACVAALLDGAGDVEVSGCEEADERAYFPEGSTCRTCLEEDGDHARCVEEEACAETATWQIFGVGNWYGVLRTSGLACAPDHMADRFLLVEDLADGDPLPETFDHGAVAAICAEGWDGDSVGFYCSFGDYHAVGDVLYSRVDYIRPAGAETTPWAGRISLVASLEVEGLPFAYSFLWEAGGTGISAPEGSVQDGWGLNPRTLRPDGVDPEDPEDTLAREYIAGFGLKMMTTRDGVPVVASNHNRCSEDAWEGPHADGTYSCDEPGAWTTVPEWRDDAPVTWWDQRAGEIYAFPIVTLASTGLPDPDVPGGLLTEVLGSTTLADPEWEGCAWPKTFVPDRVRLYDPAPGTSSEGYASFDGQTYRLGRDPDVDVRLWLATNQWRDFCPP